ncbi:hypothetical protein QBC40DRAFT_229747 [Triangularia verruculosa]|uniref:Nephrocystin 3-like N-terminal domain-containing protein n=1 Tax=Triangularia verruculosa TaxID=2587418 RepID=A0AAN6XDH0_9PEZI|nr:hypothetical protein QBC40DRAFT_229747 [Triangularia verruculosa]
MKNAAIVDTPPRDLWRLARENLDVKTVELLQRPWKNPSSTISTTESSTPARQSSTCNDTSPDVSTSINNVIDYARDRLTEYQRRWGSDAKGTAVGTARRILISMLSVKELIDAGIKFDVSGYGALAWSVLSFGLTLVQNDKVRMELSFDSAEFLADLLARCARTQTYYRDLSFDFPEGETERLENAMVAVYIAILEYSAAVKKAQDASAINRLIKSFQALTGQELTELKQNIVEGEATLSKWQESVDRECVSEVHSGIARIYHSVEDQANKILEEIGTSAKEQEKLRRELWKLADGRILDWLAKTDEDQSLAKHKKLRKEIERSEMKKYQAGKWLLDWEGYTNWKADPQGILWLHGPSGCGKSSLCSTIIKDLSDLCNPLDSNKLLVHWYFQFDKKDTKDIEVPLKSFLRQLGRCGFPGEIRSWLSSASACCPPPDNSTLIDKLVSLIGQLDSDIFMVLDGLDEFPEQSNDSAKRKEILDLISKLAQEAYPNLHLLLISKPEEGIKKHLTGNPGIAQALCEKDVGEGLQEDLEKFINTTMEENPNFSRLNHSTKSAIRKRLNEGQDRIFLWVTSILNGPDLFKLGVQDDLVKQQLSKIPSTMATRYENVLKSLDGDHVPYMRLILMWLLRHQRGGVLLTVEEIADAVELEDSSMVSTICTKTLVRTNTAERTTIEFGHFSAKEYLEGLVNKAGKEEVESKFGFSDEEAHLTILNQCLNTINSFGPGTKRTPLMEYAANHWFKHYLLLKQTGTDEHKNLQNAVADIFQPNSQGFRSWTRGDILDPDEPVHSGFDMQRGSSVQDDQKAGPVYYAVKFGVHDIAIRLIKDKCPLHTANGDKLLLYGEGPHGSPLYIASARGHMQTVTTLLQKGAKANSPEDGKFGSALHAAAFGHIDVVKQLLKLAGGNEASINLSGGIYGTALQLAAAKGNEDMVRLLVSQYEANVTEVVAKSLFGNALQAAWALHSNSEQLVEAMGYPVHDSALVGWQAAYRGIQKFGDRLDQRYEDDILPTSTMAEFRDPETHFSEQQKLLIRVRLSLDLSDDASSLASLHTFLADRFPYKTPLEERLGELNNVLSRLERREVSLARWDFRHKALFRTAVKYVLEVGEPTTPTMLVFSRLSRRDVSEWREDTGHLFERELGRYVVPDRNRVRGMDLDDLVTMELSRQRRQLQDNIVQSIQERVGRPHSLRSAERQERVIRPLSLRSAEPENEDIPPLYLVVDDLLSVLRDVIHYGILCDTAHDALQERGRNTSSDHARQTVDDLTFEVFSAILRLALAIKTRKTLELWKTISMLAAVRQPRMARLAQTYGDLREQFKLDPENQDSRRSRPDKIGQKRDARDRKNNRLGRGVRVSADLWETEDEDDLQTL